MQKLIRLLLSTLLILTATCTHHRVPVQQANAKKSSYKPVKPKDLSEYIRTVYRTSSKYYDSENRNLDKDEVTKTDDASNNTPQNDLDPHIGAARLAQQGRHFDAIDAYQQILGDSPSDIESHLALAQLWYQLGNCSNSRYHAEQVAAFDTGVPQLELLAEIYSCLEQFPSAVAVLQRAVEMKPDESSLYWKLGETLFQLENWVQAQYFLEKAVQLNPSLKPGHRLLGLSLAHLDREAMALSTLENVVARAEALYLIGRVYMDMEQWDKASGILRQALLLNKGSLPTQLALSETLAHLPPPAIVIIHPSRKPIDLIGKPRALARKDLTPKLNRSLYRTFHNDEIVTHTSTVDLVSDITGYPSVMFQSTIEPVMAIVYKIEVEPGPESTGDHSKELKTSIAQYESTELPFRKWEYSNGTEPEVSVPRAFKRVQVINPIEEVVTVVASSGTITNVVKTSLEPSLNFKELTPTQGLEVEVPEPSVVPSQRSVFLPGIEIVGMESEITVGGKKLIPQLVSIHSPQLLPLPSENALSRNVVPSVHSNEVKQPYMIDKPEEILVGSSRNFLPIENQLVLHQITDLRPRFQPKPAVSHKVNEVVRISATIVTIGAKRNNLQTPEPVLITDCPTFRLTSNELTNSPNKGLDSHVITVIADREKVELLSLPSSDIIAALFGIRESKDGWLKRSNIAPVKWSLRNFAASFVPDYLELWFQGGKFSAR